MLTRDGELGYRPGMSVFLDTTTGMGLAGRHRGAALPAAAAGRRARPRRHRHRLRRHRLELPRVDRLPAAPCSRWAWSPTWSSAPRRAVARCELRRAGVAGRRARRAAVRRLARRRRHATPGPAWSAGSLCALLGWLRRGRAGRARARARLEGGAAALLTAYADAAALLLAAIAIFVPPASILAIAGLRGAAARRAAGARARSTPACGSSASPVAAKRKKLVLAVIDSLKPDMLDLAIEEGRAPGAGGAARARHLRPRLRLDLPLGHAGGQRRDRHRATARASTTSRR